MLLRNVVAREVARESHIDEHYCHEFLKVIGGITSPQASVMTEPFCISIIFPESFGASHDDVRLVQTGNGQLLVYIHGRQGALVLLESIPEPTVIDRFNRRSIVSLAGLPRAIRRVRQSARARV